MHPYIERTMEVLSAMHLVLQVYFIIIIIILSGTGPCGLLHFHATSSVVFPIYNLLFY